MTEVFLELVCWLLTYVVHSTVLIGGVWLLTRLLPIRSNALREALWTVALFGGLVTATAQAINGVRPIGGTLLLPAVLQSSDDRVTALTGQAGSGESPRAGTVSRDDASEESTAELLLVMPVETRESSTAADRAAAPVSGSPNGRAASLAGLVWPLAAGIGALLLVLLLRMSIRFLRDRRPLEDGALRQALDRLCRSAGVSRRVRLTVSPRLSSPVAFGLLRWEVCVPERGLTDLSPAQQEAMLAHELAHLVRGDPLRLLLCRLVETVLFCQPLNRLARRRLFETIECRSDAWAISALGDGLSLAECLARVATWITVETRPATAVAMAEEGSPLGRRIHRLLREEEALADDRRRRHWVPALALLLPALVLVAPAVSIATPDPGREEGPAAVVRVHLEHADRSVLIAQLAGLLEDEISLLSDEVSGLRVTLPADATDPELNETLFKLEQRIERLKRRRVVLTTWRKKVLREHGLDSPAATVTNTSPWRFER